MVTLALNSDDFNRRSLSPVIYVTNDSCSFECSLSQSVSIIERILSLPSASKSYRISALWDSVCSSLGEMSFQDVSSLLYSQSVNGKSLQSDCLLFAGLPPMNDFISFLS